MTQKLRVAVYATLFLSTTPCLSSAPAQTKPPVSDKATKNAIKNQKSENSQDIIEKAQNLILQRDRTQAINILANAIRREAARAQPTSELKKTLNEIATLFFSDKAQQLYEVAITLKRTDLNQAQQKIAEALRMEPDNSLLIVEQARIAIAKGDCSAAEDATTKARLQNTHMEEINLVHAQAILCQGRAPELKKLLDGMDTKKSSLAKFWNLLEVENQYRQKNLAKAGELVLVVQKLDPQFPETQYWRWKIDQSLKKKNVSAVEKYLMACKNISAHLYRQYMMDPVLCRRTAEMEASEPE